MRRQLAALAVAAALVSGGCGNLLDPAAAVVYENKITVDEVTAHLASFEGSAEFERLAQQGDAQALKREVEQQVLTRLIRRAVLAPKAEDLGIEVTEDEVESRLEQIKADFPSEEAFAEALKEQGLTLADLEEIVHDNVLEEELRAEVTADAGASEEDIAAFYEENLADFSETRVSHILVGSRTRAAALSAQLRAAPKGEVDELFARLARENSIDESNAQRGGDLGWQSLSTYVKPFADAAAELDPGEISAPVETEFGYHVIHVTGRRTRPLEAVRTQIEQRLSADAQDEAWIQWLRDAYEEADVRVNPRYGEFDEETLEVVNVTAEDVPGAAEPTTQPTDAATPQP